MCKFACAHFIGRKHGLLLTYRFTVPPMHFSQGPIHAVDELVTKTPSEDSS